jgi:hypothetical protein
VLVVTGCVVVVGLVTAVGWSCSRSQRAPSFTDRAVQVLQAWRRAATDPEYGTRVRLLDAPLVRPAHGVPDDAAGFFLRYGLEGHDQNQFGRQPPDGVVVLSTGATMPVPVLPADAAYSMVNTYSAVGGTGPACSLQPQSCPVLTVTGFRLATVTLRSNHGPAVLPAWRFSVTESTDPVTLVAVWAQVLAPLPRLDSARVMDHADRWYGSPTGVAVSAMDPAVSGSAATWLVTTTRFPACRGEPPRFFPVVYEAPDAVVLGVAIRTVHPSPCPEGESRVSLRVPLSRPLGQRVLLDGVTGQPMPLRVTG